MTERETTRLIAWATELRRAHVRLRQALAVVRDGLHGGQQDPLLGRELLLYCHGFCTALDRHHQGEDRRLFPAIEAAYPDLAPVLRRLEQDHTMIANLLDGLRTASASTSDAEKLEQHLDGIAAIMESHFRYEERQLLTVLETLQLDAAVAEVLGPL